MPDKSTRRTEEVILGKKFPGEKFSTVRSTEDVIADHELQSQYANESNAIPLSVYFVIRGHSDPVLQRMLESHTKVRTATKEAFDKLFHSFFSTESLEKEAPAAADEQTEKEV